MFDEEEVKATVWDYDNFKSPCLDGFNLDFLKELWDDVKYDFMMFLQEFHVSSKLVNGSNCAFIVLILKTKFFHQLNDFRPISLVGCIIKF